MFKRALLTAALFSSAAHAQTAPAPPSPAPSDALAATQSQGRVSYDAAYFAQFNPQTALDMVRQLPGFALDGGDDRRGFSGAVGNLLIDGLRPSAKSQGIDSILSRIPAAQVVRIELLRGAEAAGDASGQSVIANVVRTPAAGSGVYEAGFELTDRNRPAPRGELSYAGRNGQFEYGLGASVLQTYRSLGGWRRLSDANETLTQNVETPSPRGFYEAALNANAAAPLWGGRFSVTGQLDDWHFDANSGYLFFDPAGAPLSAQASDYREGGDGYELGLNYDRDFGPWSLALIGLANRSTFWSHEELSQFDAGGAQTELVRQVVDNDNAESILRASLTRALAGGHRLEFGGETAFNSLEQSLALASDTGAGPTPIPLPNSNVLVEEERAELFATHAWSASNRWGFETRLAWETSTLTFTGDADQSVELSFWKPSIQASHNFGDNNQVRLRLYRDVGQLDFGDFVSAAAIVDGTIDGGNPDLAPTTSWRAELGADLRLPGGAALSLELTRHWISDAADVVLLTAPNPNQDPNDPNDDLIRFDAPGNIGDADAVTLEINLTAPLSPLIPGGRLTLEAELTDSEVTDPLTGQRRVLSYTPESELEFEFRQDIASWKFAWGISYYKEAELQAYRFNEIDTNEEGPWVDIFVETTALPRNAKLRVWAANILDGTVNRDRAFYAPDRAGAFSGRDLRERRFGQAPWLTVELSGTF